MPNIEETRHEKLIPIDGTPVDMLNPPAGCPFGPRCEFCMNICLRENPPLIQVEEGHRASCWLYVEQAQVACERGEEIE
jgi:oligopeptide transport system ATP-binding protein